MPEFWQRWHFRWSLQEIHADFPLEKGKEEVSGALDRHYGRDWSSLKKGKKVKAKNAVPLR